MSNDDTFREDALNRLKRIEGQVRGLQRLVKQGAPCRKMASQVKAVRTALDATGKLILACYVTDMLKKDDIAPDEAAELLMKF